MLIIAVLASIGVLFPMITGIALGIIILAYITRWLIHSPERCFYALIITLPLESAAVLEIGFTLRLSYILICLCAISTWIFNKRKTTPNYSVITPLVLYTLVCVFSFIQIIIFPPPSISNVLAGIALRASGIRYFVQLFLLLLHVILFINILIVVKSKEQIQKMISIYVLISILISAYALYQPLAIAFDLPLKSINNAMDTGGDSYGKLPYASGAFVDVRPNSTFQEPGNLGQYLLSSLGILMVYNPFRKRKFEYARFAAIAVLFAGIAVTVSRGTFLSMVPMLIVLIFSKIRKHATFGIIALGISVVVFASIVFPVIEVTSKKDFTFLSVITGRFGADTMDNDVRKDYSHILFSVWSKHPIIGVGLGAYGYYGGAKLHAPVMLSSHGFWWSVLAETGIVGLLLCIWFIGGSLLTIYKRFCVCSDNDIKSLLGGIFAALIGVFFQYMFLGDRLSSYVWFLLGLGVAASLIAANEKKYSNLDTKL